MNQTLMAFIKQKCPRCHTGDMFPGGTYNLTQFGKVYNRCPHCDLNYEIEPGFFTGAMYFSYAINVAIIVTSFLFVNIFFDWHVFTVVGFVLTCVVVMLPFTFRLSRMLMMYLFSGIYFDENYVQKS